MIKIIADSGCDFTEEMLKRNVSRIPLTLQLGDKIYEDTHDLNISDYINTLNSNPKGRKSAAPSPEKYFNEYKDGEAVFVVTLSRHLSGSYASACTAAHMYHEDIGDKFIHVIDSKSASAGQTAIVHELMRLIDRGLSAEKIKVEIDSFVDKLNTFFILECFNTIVDSGRMNAYVAKLASMLNIVPICAGVEGKMALLTQTRGRKKAYAKLADLMKETGVDTTQKTLFITHVDNRSEAESLASYYTDKLGFNNYLITDATGLVSTYADYHGLIIAF